MPKGLKETSGLITIGFSVNETVPNTMAEDRIDLQLNVLDREVFIVYGLSMDISPPEMIQGVNTATFASISTTSRTTVGNLSNSNVLATAGNQIESDATGAVGFSYSSADAPATQLEQKNAPECRFWSCYLKTALFGTNNYWIWHAFAIADVQE